LSHWPDLFEFLGHLIYFTKLIQRYCIISGTVSFFLNVWKWLRADVYLRLDPLLGLNAVLAAREIISRALWSLVVGERALPKEEAVQPKKPKGFL